MLNQLTGTVARLLGFAALFVLFCGFVVITGGLAKIQKDTNKLGHNPPDAVVTEYDQTYSYALITPYAGSPGWQFAYIWFIIMFNLFNFLLCSLVLALPAMFFVIRPGVLALLAVATTLTVTVVNNLEYLHRSPTAQTVYGKSPIDATYAGVLLVVLGDFGLIMTIGFWAFEATTGAGYYGTNKRGATAATAGEPATATTTV